jgi:hypothetical protein
MKDLVEYYYSNVVDDYLEGEDARQSLQGEDFKEEYRSGKGHI